MREDGFDLTLSPTICLSGDNNPVLGLLSGGHAQKLLRAGKEKMGNNKFPEVVSQRKVPVPGGTQCQGSSCTWTSSRVISLVCAGTDTHRQEYRAHQHTHCTTRSVWESWQSGSSEVFFLLGEPLPHPATARDRGYSIPTFTQPAPGAILGMDNSCVHQHRSERNTAPV